MNQTIEEVKNRKYFYRDYYRRACTALWIALVIIIVLSLLLLYLYIQRPTPDFYATSSDGKLVPLVPLDSPNYSHVPLIE